LLCEATGQDKDCIVTVEELRSYSTETLMSADIQLQGQIHLSEGWFGLLPWSPNVDGKFVVAQPFKGYAKGMPAKPFMFGFNRNDSVSIAYAFYAVAGGFLNFKRNALYTALLIELFGDASTIEDINAYSPANAPQLSLWNNEAAIEAFNNLVNDMAFRCGALNTAQAALTKNKKNKQSIFGYAFVQYPDDGLVLDSDNVPVCQYPYQDVCHTAELPFVFNTLELFYPDGIVPVSDQEIAKQMGLMWGTFAKTSTVESLGYLPFDSSSTLNPIGDGSIETDVYSYSNCAFWLTQIPFATNATA